MHGNLKECASSVKLPTLPVHLYSFVKLGTHFLVPLQTKFDLEMERAQGNFKMVQILMGYLEVVTRF